jgi:putative transposase
MSTHTQLLYHIVFSTKNRQRTLDLENRTKLLKYIWGIIKNQKSHLYRINAVDDHLHILTHIHPTIALSDFVKTIKTSATTFGVGYCV